jgi:hypothetical protein
LISQSAEYLRAFLRSSNVILESYSDRNIERDKLMMPRHYTCAIWFVSFLAIKLRSSLKTCSVTGMKHVAICGDSALIAPSNNKVM